MKSLSKLKILKSMWTLKSFCRPVHKVTRHLASQITSHYESINRYELEVPEHFNFANDVLDKWAQLEKDGKRPANPAFWWVNDKKDEVKWSFKELGLLSRKAANVLSDPCSLQRGDRIIVILPRIPEWWLLNVACMRTGIVFIPGTSLLTAKDISYRLQASRAKAIVVTDALAPAVDSVMPGDHFLKAKLLISNSSRDGWLNFNELLKVASADHHCVKTKSQEPMVIYFTSGSTGSPKMAEHSHSSYGIGFAASSRHWLNLTPLDIFWNTSDTGWVKSAWSSVFSPWIAGSCVFVHHMPQFELTTILNTLSSYPITTFCTAPTAFRMLVRQDLTSYKFMSLQHCVTGGEPLNPEVMVQWKTQTGLDIYEGYGQSETIVDEQGNILPSGEEGDIAIRIKPRRPFCLFTQYLDNPEKTASTERGDFYITGDRGIMDKEGYFWFVGRSDDVINSSGYRIGPFEVESALIEHPAVVESAVVSSPDSIRGEVVKAFVVLSPDFTLRDPEKLAAELQEHVKKVTAPYKYPRKVEFVQELPKTVAGKIQRKVLRNKEWGRD
uniref:medium-chain acyl-CoA ligase n=1 Tax=Sphenodon punctatus TaxID=8508 RepID=A0A8D0GEA1_SPHPU